MQWTLDGLIIRQQPSDEDRIVHILTREMGVVTAYAKGARRPRSKLAAGTEVLSYARVVLFKSKNWFYVDAAEVIDGFFALRQDITGLSLAAYIAELSDEMAPKEAEADDYLRLALNCLHFLREKSRDEKLIKAIAELRMLTLSGYMPDLVACSGCGVYESDIFYFLPRSGEICCPNCLPQPPREAVMLSSPVAAALRHIIYASLDDLFSFQLGSGSLPQLGAASEQYLIAQLEHRPRTLDFYNSISLN